MAIALNQVSSEILNYSDAGIRSQSSATWDDYVSLRDKTSQDWRKIVFNEGYLWVDIGQEGPNHAAFSDLMTILFGF